MTWEDSQVWTREWNISWSYSVSSTVPAENRAWRVMVPKLGLTGSEPHLPSKPTLVSLWQTWSAGAKEWGTLVWTWLNPLQGLLCGRMIFWKMLLCFCFLVVSPHIFCKGNQAVYSSLLQGRCVFLDWRRFLLQELSLVDFYFIKPEESSLGGPRGRRKKQTS